MVNKLGWAFGVVLTLVGLAGFIPALVMNGALLGIFMIDPLHNIVHILSGVAALAAVMMSMMYVKLYFKVFGVIYALVAVVGFVDPTVFGLMMMNMADNLLHVVIAVVALWAGFGMKGDMMM
jgi:hypothetical protein